MTLSEIQKKPFRRLSKDVVPILYKICTKINVNAKEFSGTSKIDLKVYKETSTIEFHCLDLNLSQIKFVTDKNVEHRVIKQEFDSNLETIKLIFESPIPVCDGTLHMNFDSKLVKGLYGLYYCTYIHDNVEKTIVCTQFESTFARKAFPCWDEPAFKATFKISLIVPKEMVALSNMEIISRVSHADPDYSIVTYAETPIMSTYLVAYVVGDLECISSKTCHNKPVSVYTPIGKKDHGAFSLDIACKAIPFYENYFDIDYPISKVDLVAIPDFAAGAMENWGLTTYRETALLVDPKHSSAAGKQRVALVVAHELAHQWFGNIVTMEWWTHLWLNEGFATWIEYLLVDEFFPKYDIWTQFVSTDYSRCLELDSLDNSHPIEVEVGHPSEIDEIFDSISYSKGSCVIRLLYDYLGKDAFRKGLQTYLKEFAFSNASTHDLWRHLAIASGKPVVDVMSCWTTKTGYPVLDINTKQIDDDTIELFIKQQRFVVSSTDLNESSVWMIPITICADYQKEPIHTFLMDKPQVNITLKLTQKLKWLKLNRNQVGLYRVNYSEEMLKPLLEAFAKREFCANERLGIQSDIFSLSKLGRTDAINYFDIFLSSSQEDNYTVWSDICTNLSNIRCLIQDFDKDGKLETCFNKMIRSIFNVLLNKLGWESNDQDDHLGNLLRSLVISMLGAAGDEIVIKEAQKRFKQHLEKTKLLSPDLRRPVYSIVISNGGQQEYDILTKIYLESTLQEEKVVILSILGRCKNLDISRQILEFSLSDNVRSSDALYGIIGYSTSVQARKERWEFLKLNWERIGKMYNNGGFLFNRLVGVSISCFSSLEILQDIIVIVFL